MAGQCNPTFDEIARKLGDFTCQDAPAIIHLRNPFGLSNWTLPVVELMMVAGAVLALWYSIRRLRRHGDPVNLALWIATVVYLFVIEIPLYFPDSFGIEEDLGIVFAHNAFTVQFMFERLPLYIIALYPAVITVAFEIVRSLGVFRDRGIVVGAICVGFVHHCFYEVFDQLGPQLRWWAWNTDNATNHPLAASVPMTSMVIFATLGPFAATLLVMRLVGRKSEKLAESASPARLSGVSLGWRSVVAGVLVPVGVGILSTPSSVVGRGDTPNTTAQAIVFWIELVIFAAISVPVLVQQWSRHRNSAEGIPTNEFVRVFAPIYLVVLAVLWVSALPDYFGAVDGITSDDTPIGNVWYATGCLIIAALAGLSVSVRTRTVSAREISRV
ncbi:hypothetical protein [Nocardia noduli]|uniref:hypothetical protein n=1 Tax=Nocardia noduli TaxID=2815722 RepID=UPI001C218AF3|nr:hypothetical protein [Nocardia noduli]